MKRRRLPGHRRRREQRWPARDRVQVTLRVGTGMYFLGTGRGTIMLGEHWHNRVRVENPHAPAGFPGNPLDPIDVDIHVTGAE